MLMTKDWQKFMRFTFFTNELVKGMCFDFRSNHATTKMCKLFFFSTDTNTISIESLSSSKKKTKSFLCEYVCIYKFKTHDNNFINLNLHDKALFG